MDIAEQLRTDCDWCNACRHCRKLMNNAAKEIEQLRTLNKRALAIITDAVMHGLPVSEEVAAVRNAIVGATVDPMLHRAGWGSDDLIG